MKKILGYTLKPEDVFRSKEVFMTKLETECLYCIMSALDDHDPEKRRYVDVLVGICEGYESENSVEGHIDVYEQIMSETARYLGSIGSYDESDAVSRMLIEQALINRRLFTLDRSIHCIYLNNERRIGKGIPADSSYDPKVYLDRCRALNKLKEQEDL